jgi:hypothetical protein
MQYWVAVLSPNVLSDQETSMQLARTNNLYVVVLIGVILIGVATLGSIPHTAVGIEHEVYLSRHVAVRLASLTSPDPDPRHPADWPRVWAASLDREVGEYLSQLAVVINDS